VDNADKTVAAASSLAILAVEAEAAERLAESPNDTLRSEDVVFPAGPGGAVDELRGEEADKALLLLALLFEDVGWESAVTFF
jgi:hypothetical protein